MLSDMDAWKAADEDTETLHETPPNATTTLSLASRSLLNDYTDLLPYLEFVYTSEKQEGTLGDGSWISLPRPINPTAN